ncbi:hypothetical protein [Sphingomonas endolithica]|uniref:hypothetical protein n=1 Tax=Sphingomonas endolithica TaxID=2972485 RepID=UPI0021B06127|nr:hypothetical protein [Sphingomonas sp. ZFBP2030]
MPRATPLLLAAGTRFAGLSQTRARWVLGLLALLLAISLSALATPRSTGLADRGDTQTDLALYDSIVSGVRAGGEYYGVAAAALRNGNYPLKPFVTFRLPTLATLQASMPSALWSLLLHILAAAVALAWFIRLRPAFARPPSRATALLLLGGGLIAFVQSGLAGLHEIWAGLIIALSLALRRPGRWVEAAAFGMIAMLFRETAALYVGIMAAIALMEGNRREAYGWLATLAAFAIVIMFHAHAVAQVVRPLDPSSPGWDGMLGFGFFVSSMTVSTALALAPAWLAALLVALTLFGWAAWDDPLALRALATFCGYATLLALFGRSDTFYWGLMIAPTILIGLAFVPDALRETVLAARNPRRITVTRLTR